MNILLSFRARGNVSTGSKSASEKVFQLAIQKILPTIPPFQFLSDVFNSACLSALLGGALDSFSGMNLCAVCALVAEVVPLLKTCFCSTQDDSIAVCLLDEGTGVGSRVHMLPSILFSRCPLNSNGLPRIPLAVSKALHIVTSSPLRRFSPFSGGAKLIARRFATQGAGGAKVVSRPNSRLPHLSVIFLYSSSISILWFFTNNLPWGPSAFFEDRLSIHLFVTLSLLCPFQRLKICKRRYRTAAGLVTMKAIVKPKDIIGGFSHPSTPSSDPMVRNSFRFEELVQKVSTMTFLPLLVLSFYMVYFMLVHLCL